MVVMELSVVDSLRRVALLSRTGSFGVLGGCSASGDGINCNESSSLCCNVA